MEEKLKDLGFRLHYECFDRGGTAGVSTPLTATDSEAAAKEARRVLIEMGALPEQAHVTITHSFALDVADLNLGKRET